MFVFGESEITRKKAWALRLIPFFVPSLAQSAERVDEMLYVACKRVSRRKCARLLDAHSDPFLFTIDTNGYC